jgi:hypothetical protein
VSGLEEIIERDYFPVLTGLGDSDTADDDVSVLTADSGGTIHMNKPNVLDMSMRRYLAAYTSEDNASFERQLNRDQAAHRRKYHFAYEDDSGDPGRRPGMLRLYHTGTKIMTSAQRADVDKALALPAALGDDRPNNPDSWRFRVRNHLMFPPDIDTSRAVSRVTREEQQAEQSPLPLLLKNSPAGPGNGDISDRNRTEEHHSNQRNNNPNRHHDGRRPDQSASAYGKQATHVQRENTRLRGDFLMRLAGRSLPVESPHTETTYSSSAFSDSADDEAGEGDREYGLVPMTPVVTPGHAGVEPLLTWGRIFALPQNLEAYEDEGAADEADSDDWWMRWSEKQRRELQQDQGRGKDKDKDRSKGAGGCEEDDESDEEIISPPQSDGESDVDHGGKVHIENIFAPRDDDSLSSRSICTWQEARYGDDKNNVHSERDRLLELVDISDISIATSMRFHMQDKDVREGIAHELARKAGALDKKASDDDHGCSVASVSSGAAGISQTQTQIQTQTQAQTRASGALSSSSIALYNKLSSEQKIDTSALSSIVRSRGHASSNSRVPLPLSDSSVSVASAVSVSRHDKPPRSISSVSSSVRAKKKKPSAAAMKLAARLSKKSISGGF